MMNKFNIGDKIKVVNCGHPYWEGGIQKDMLPQIIGRMGIVSGRSEVQGSFHYTVEGIPEKHAWYYADQLELINANPNVLEQG